MLDWSDPETFWLNVTNAVLGLVVIAAVLALVGELGYEALSWVRRRLRIASDAHSLAAPDLGVTMADGGERVDESDRDAERAEPGSSRKS